MLRTSVEDIAQMTGISTATLRRWCDKGLIDHKRDYKGWRWFDEPKKAIKQVKSLLDGEVQSEKQS